MGHCTVSQISSPWVPTWTDHHSPPPPNTHTWIILRYTTVIEGQAKLAQLPATQFQNGYSHCVNKIHKVEGPVGLP